MTAKRVGVGMARILLAVAVGYVSIVLVPDSLPWLARAVLDILAVALAAFVLVAPLPSRSATK